MKTYKEHVDPYIFDAQRRPIVPVVVISQKQKQKVADFLVRFTAEKAKEDVHLSDATNREKRFGTGFLGEAAMEQFLGRTFMDLTVGDSTRYAVSDLRSIGIDAGVKTGVYEFDKFPAINRNINKPQVICLLSSCRTKVLVAGLATVDVLQTYTDDSLIKTRDMSSRKTGFYGFHKLIKISGYDDLRKLAPLS